MPSFQECDAMADFSKWFNLEFLKCLFYFIVGALVGKGRLKLCNTFQFMLLISDLCFRQTGPAPVRNELQFGSFE